MPATLVELLDGVEAPLWVSFLESRDPTLPSRVLNNPVKKGVQAPMTLAELLDGLEAPARASGAAGAEMRAAGPARCRRPWGPRALLRQALQPGTWRQAGRAARRPALLKRSAPLLRACAAFVGGGASLNGTLVA